MSNRVVAYYTNWARWRPDTGKFMPGNIDPSLVTHVIYAFGSLNADSLKIQINYEDNEDIEKVMQIKNNGVKVLIAIGGWNDSASDKYSRLVGDPSARAAFIDDILSFMDKFGFEGLDVDWEYPTKPQGGNGNPADKQNFAQFLSELSNSFKPRGLLLTTAVSANKTTIDSAYDIQSMANSVDWINLMTYDFHGSWDRKTGHNAPFVQQPGDVDYFNVTYAANYWLQGGMPADKIVLGIPCYGQSFTLANPDSNGINQETYGPGDAGEFTRQGGLLAYYEILDRIQNRGWQVVQNDFGPYAFQGNQWVSYDDPDSAMKKVEFVKSQGLGGAMIWALDFDDFQGTVGGQKYPLLSAIKSKFSTFIRSKL